MVTQLSTLIGSNAAANMIPFFKGAGENWQTALFGLGFQIVLHSAFASAKYIQDKPDPNVIEQDSNPQAFIKTPEQKPNENQTPNP